MEDTLEEVDRSREAQERQRRRETRYLWAARHQRLAYSRIDRHRQLSDMEWAMLGSNQRPLPCEVRALLSWMFAVVQKYLQISIFFLRPCCPCSSMFVWVGVPIGVVAAKLTLWRSSLGRPVAGLLRVRGRGEALLRVGRVVVGAVDVVVDARLVAFHYVARGPVFLADGWHASA
jgi:hypothetical protein